jgi:hypothetical protein
MSLTNFTIQLKIINCQEKCETNFILWIHTQSFFYTLSALKFGHPVAHGEHPVEIPILPSMLLLIVVTTSLICVFRSSTSVTLVGLSATVWMHHSRIAG